MDFQQPLIFTASALIIPFLILILLEKWKKSIANKHINLPPGPKKLPIIGHIHLLGSLPHHSLADLAKKYGPLMHLKFGEVSNFIVTSPELAKDVLKVHDPNFADKPGTMAIKIMYYDFTDISYSPYGDYWRQTRRICVQELLSPKNVRSFGSIRNDEVSRLVEFIKVSPGLPINLREKIFALTSAVTCRAAFGKVMKERDTLIKLLKEGALLAGGFELVDLFPSSKILTTFSWNRLKLLKMRRKLDSILDAIIHEHKQNSPEKQDSTIKGNGEFGNEDLVDVFLRVKESGELEIPLTIDNVKAVIYDMFSAGTETSSTTVDWIMVELIRNPRAMAKVQAEIREVFKGGKIIDEVEVQKLKYLKLVIKETLRLHPPFALILRASREAREIGGYTIPAKSKIIVNNWGLGRDPKNWTNPESFEPERFEDNSVDFMGAHFQFLPFGAGRRICPGIAFGLASVELPLAQLLYSFDWKLPQGMKAEDLDMTENPGISASRRDDLLLVATPYNP